jgi:triphosphoribosyl-dephospho-CoA synthase
MTEHSARYIPQATPREVANAAASALILGYSAPMPGSDSRYSDVTAAHEARLLGVPALAAAFSGATTSPVGETVLEAVSGSLSVAGYADLRTVGYLAPLARAALLGERLGEILGGLSHTDALLFTRALQATGPKSFDQRLGRALDYALSAGREATLRDAMRFAAAGTPGEPLAREYAQSYEITRELARPALLNALMRVEATRPAFVQAYLEVLSEVPDLDVAQRAGRREAEEASRMANGVLKSGGVYSRRGLQAIANLDGLLRSDGRLVPTATETPVVAAAFLLALQQGDGFLNHRVRPAARG